MTCTKFILNYSVKTTCCTMAPAAAHHTGTPRSLGWPLCHSGMIRDLHLHSPTFNTYKVKVISSWPCWAGHSRSLSSQTKSLVLECVARPQSGEWHDEDKGCSVYYSTIVSAAVCCKVVANKLYFLFSFAFECGALSVTASCFSYKCLLYSGDHSGCSWGHLVPRGACGSSSSRASGGGVGRQEGNGVTAKLLLKILMISIFPEEQE